MFTSKVMKAFLKLNISIAFLGLVGVFETRFLKLILKSNLRPYSFFDELDAFIKIACVLLIWILHMKYSYNSEDHSIGYVLITMLHSLLWSFVLLIAYFGGGAMLG